MKVETLVKQGWYNEYPSTINLKCNKLSLEVNALSDTSNQNATGTDSSSDIPQIQAADPNNSSKPQFEKMCSVCRKNNHSVPT